MDTEIFALNKNFERSQTPIDTYSSLQWSPNYNEIGIFELHAPIKFSGLLVNSSYIENTADPDHIGVIEYYEKTTDEQGNEAIMVRGRFFESVLERRVVVRKQRYSANPTNIISDLLTEHVINPTDPKRKINSVVLGTLYYPEVTVASYSALRTDLLTEVRNLCKSCGMGFRMKLVENNGQRVVEFETYMGEDNGVVFSRDRENVSTLEYYKDLTTEVNVMYVEGAEDVSLVVDPDDASGIDRIESLLDATSWTIGADSESYPETLQTRAELELKSLVITEGMDAKIANAEDSAYGTAYSLGDEAILSDDTMGVSSKVRIQGVTHLWDVNGYSLIVNLGSTRVTIYDKIKYISDNIL